MLFFLSEFLQQKQSTEERTLEVLNFFSIKPVSRILGGTGGRSGGPRGVQAAFFEIKSSLKPNHVVKKISSQASNQIAVPKNCQIKPQIKSGSSNFHQIKSQIKPPAYEFSQIKSQIKSQPQNFRQIKSQIT